MSWQAIGELALNLSSLLYFIWFIPQLILTFKQRQTSSLSLGMHGLLTLGYIGDLVYGYGQHLPMQYKAVTIAGLSMLTIQHYQFWRYSRWKGKEKTIFLSLTFILLILFLAGLCQITLVTRNAAFYNAVGFLSWACWLSFFWPQLLKNFSNQAATGVSAHSVLLSLLSSIGDIVSAFALAWAWPSKLGTLLGLLPKSLLLLQCCYYQKRLGREAVHASS